MTNDSSTDHMLWRSVSTPMNYACQYVCRDPEDNELEVIRCSHFAKSMLVTWIQLT
ncbi:hypothetical protein HDF08_000418 [Edaphobacter lichenicola]|uniref:Uncharacterized protein n=1 Tax=Tunturiibacter lichenicola TaxID=2051959 RepID=A0A852VAM1_9BACT|nr:hypothetical protein [Edaphobacter lichenicola]